MGNFILLIEAKALLPLKIYIVRSGSLPSLVFWMLHLTLSSLPAMGGSYSQSPFHEQTLTILLRQFDVRSAGWNIPADVFTLLEGFPLIFSSEQAVNDAMSIGMVSKSAVIFRAFMLFISLVRCTYIDALGRDGLRELRK